MERILWSTPNEVLMAHAEWLPGVQLRHSVPPVQRIVRARRSSGYHSSVAKYCLSCQYNQVCNHAFAMVK